MGVRAAYLRTWIMVAVLLAWTSPAVGQYGVRVTSASQAGNLPSAEEGQPIPPLTETIAPPVPPIDPSPLSSNGYQPGGMDAGPPVIRPNFDHVDNGGEGFPYNPGSWELPGHKLGWFANAEASTVLPFVHSKINSAGTSLDTVFNTPVYTPFAQIGWTVMPKVEVGYRFEEGLGEYRWSYRHVGGDGHRVVQGFDAAGAGNVNSTFQADILDMDYCFTELNLMRWPRVSLLFMDWGRRGNNLDLDASSRVPPMQLRWITGFRVSQVFLQSTGTGQQVLQESVSNNFRGGGLHFGTIITQAMPWKPVALYAKFEASGQFGSPIQRYGRSAIVNGVVVSDSTSRHQFLGIATLGGELGISYVLPKHQHCRVTSGYTVEQWWSLGEVVHGTGAELFINGVFLRAEFGY